MMASSSQRDRNKRARLAQSEAERGDALLGDLDVEQGSELDEAQRVTSLPKSPLHLLLMVVSPGCPLSAGDLLYVNVGKRHRPGTMELLSDGTLRTDDGVRSSLALAAHHYMPWRRTPPDGWELVKYPHPAKPGKYMSMNTLFEECWRNLGATLDDLEDESRIHAMLVARGHEREADMHYRAKRPARARRRKGEGT